MDRNWNSFPTLQGWLKSLSVRRAWIEMEQLSDPARMAEMSLSVRRAWIEITVFLILLLSGLVALRKESVDRNS